MVWRHRFPVSLSNNWIFLEGCFTFLNVIAIFFLYFHGLSFLCAEMRALRLTGGLDRCAGKLEIHRNGTWGSLCDNSWSLVEASVVCSMLQCGAPQNFSRIIPRSAHHEGTPWYYYLCPPSFSSLWECPEYINNNNLCVDPYPSAVICNGECHCV